jgi:hypothetical protein
MPSYAKEKQDELMEMIREILVIKPKASCEKIKAVLAQNGVSLDKNYINKLKNKIHAERALRYNNAAVNEAIAQFDDFIKVMGKELLKIKKESTDEWARMEAVKLLVANYKALLNLQFDMGVFEKKLGMLQTKTEITNIAEILKIITEAENDLKSKRTNNQDDDTRPDRLP